MTTRDETLNYLAASTDDEIRALVAEARGRPLGAQETITAGAARLIELSEQQDADERARRLGPADPDRSNQ